MNGNNKVPSIDNFNFVKVLSSTPEYKSIVILLEEKETSKQGIILINKEPFDIDNVKEWIKECSLEYIDSNDIYGNFNITFNQLYNKNKCTFIYPCTEKHIIKYTEQKTFLIKETGENYKKITLPYLQENVGEVTWIKNIFEKGSEKESIIYEDKDPEIGFLLLADLKWDRKTTSNMYLQVIVNKKDLKSVRDLNFSHLPLLENIRTLTYNTLKKNFNIERNEVVMYFHYQPTYYHLHVHVTPLSLNHPNRQITSLLLEEVIDNIKLMPNYYQLATLSFIGKEMDDLCQRHLHQA
uniref:m7GpppX diphosphatase n=1 Tax=Parastrongyloides trichosuri TaxID=131310 RepID=A0A0N4Z1P2_PARTI